MCYLAWKRSMPPSRKQHWKIHSNFPLTDRVPAEDAHAFQALLEQRHEADYRLCVQYPTRRTSSLAQRMEIPLYPVFKGKCKNGLRVGCGCGNKGAGSLALFNRDVLIHIVQYDGDLWMEVEANIISIHPIGRVYLLVRAYGRQFLLEVPLFTYPKG